MKLRQSGRRGTIRPPNPATPPGRRGARRGNAAGPAGGGRRGLWSFLSRWRLTPPRAAAILGILAASGAIYGIAATPAFTLARTEFPELRWTTREALVGAFGVPDGTSLFRLETAPVEARLRDLPAVAEARVAVSLPDTIVVEVTERDPILVWAAGTTLFLVDRDGVLFVSPSPESVVVADLRTVHDERPESTALGVGSVLDPVDLDAATRIGSLVPADIGSHATLLVVTVTEANGFVVATTPRSWTAVFGLYTPSLRTPDMIPAQVRLLRSLLSGREDALERVILADADSGTFTLKPTAAP